MISEQENGKSVEGSVRGVMQRTYYVTCQKSIKITKNSGQLISGLKFESEISGI
jgi:hypothetical protein